MKIILIVFLAITSLYSQADTLKIILSSDADEAISLVMQLYRGYETDCYADSVQVWNYPPENYDRGYVCDSIKVKVPKWKHKEPNFTEFMNYLKRWW
jgi:hypothetical protein